MNLVDRCSDDRAALFILMHLVTLIKAASASERDRVLLIKSG